MAGYQARYTGVLVSYGMARKTAPMNCCHGPVVVEIMGTNSARPVV